MPTAGKLAARENKRIKPVAPVRKSLFEGINTVYCYRNKSRYQIGPTTTGGVCWFFTRDDEKCLTDETVFYFANSATQRIHKSKLRLRIVNETTLEAYESDESIGRELSSSDRDKVLGVYVKETQNEVYPQIVHEVYVKQ